MARSSTARKTSHDSGCRREPVQSRPGYSASLCKHQHDSCLPSSRTHGRRSRSSRSRLRRRNPHDLAAFAVRLHCQFDGVRILVGHRLRADGDRDVSSPGCFQAWEGRCHPHPFRGGRHDGRVRHMPRTSWQRPVKAQLDGRGSPPRIRRPIRPIRAAPRYGSWTDDHDGPRMSKMLRQGRCAHAAFLRVCQAWRSLDVPHQTGK